MKLRKFIAGMAVSALAVSSFAAAASANEAFLMYTDDSWAWGCWSAGEFPDGTVDVTGDGTYTVFIDSSIDTAMVEDEDTGELVPVQANGAMVFCVDIEGLGSDIGFASAGVDGLDTTADKMKYCNDNGVYISDVKITTYNSDGSSSDIAVDQSKILYGDIEGNGKLRIEIQNEYGDTVKDPAIDKSTISFDEKIAVTFTINGISGVPANDAVDAAPADEAPADEAPAPATGDVAAATASTKGSPDTGVADVAVVAGIALAAAGALVVAKKRK